MKRFYSTLAVFLMIVTLWAQSPEKMSYQAVVRNADNNLVINQQIGIQISILMGSSNGTIVYQETQTPNTNANGLLTIEIGTGTTSDDFSSIDWSLGECFIKTEIDISGGTDYTITGTNQLLSVPYALHAKSAIESDPIYSTWDKSEGINITESQISDLQNYLTSEADSSVENEIQTIFRVDRTVTLSHNGGTYQDSVNTQNLNSVLTEGNDAGGLRITNIASPTEAKDAATKAYVDALLTEIQFLGSILADSGLIPTTVMDINSNEYPIVRIGSQLWMGENLRTSKFNDGTTISYKSSATVTTGTYAWYENNISYKTTYGALYDNYAVSSNKLCPLGWHVPTDEDWTTLINYLGGIEIAGGKLKETGTEHWEAPNSGATNETGFTAIPGGIFDKTGAFHYMGGMTGWWSSDDDKNVYYITKDNGKITILAYPSEYGHGVRCIKD